MADSKELQDEKLRLEGEKLKHEIRKLEHETSAKAQRLDRIRGYAGATGLVTALVGVIGLFFSIRQGFDQVRQSNQLRVAEQYERALGGLAEGSDPKRLSGVMSLRKFLEDPERRTGAAQALASALAFEKDRVVRNAIEDALNPKNLDTKTAKAVLEVLITNSRGLVEDGNLRLLSLTQDDRVASPASPLSRAASVGRLIAELSRTPNVGVDDYSGIYCARCNYSYAELNGVHFDNAVLYRADFSNAQLEKATFNRAVIEGAVFERANLQGAAITHIPQGGEPEFANPPIEAYDLEHYRPSRISFDCADLRGAQFNGQVWFPFSNLEDDRFLTPSQMLSPSFYRANIEDADFTAVDLYVVTADPRNIPRMPAVRSFLAMNPRPLKRENLQLPEGLLESSNLRRALRQPVVRLVGYRLIIGTDSEVMDETETSPAVEEMLSVFERAFYESNWQNAKLRKSFRAWLKSRTFSARRFRDPKCEPRTPWNRPTRP